MIFEKDKPYTLSLIYKRKIPKSTGGSGIGIGGNVHFTDVGKVEFKKERTIRVKTEEEGKEIVEKILKMKFCYKCQDPGVMIIDEDFSNRYTFEKCKKRDIWTV